MDEVPDLGDALPLTASDPAWLAVALDDLSSVHADHLPPFTLSEAIAYSCNYYFATLGQRLKHDELIETLRPLGFAQRTGIAEDEAGGVLLPCQTTNGIRESIPQSDCCMQCCGRRKNGRPRRAVS